VPVRAVAVRVFLKFLIDLLLYFFFEIEFAILKEWPLSSSKADANWVKNKATNTIKSATGRFYSQCPPTLSDLISMNLLPFSVIFGMRVVPN
jgi:hypothetical protein